MADLFPGTLALVGSGEYLPAMEPVDRRLLDRAGPAPRVVCLPTAAGTEGAAVIERWSRMGVAHFARLGAAASAVPVIDRRTADDDGLAAQVQAADFVYLSGGRPAYLYAALAGTRTLRALQAVLARGGVVAGCSAGAMIWGAVLPRLSWSGWLGPGLGYLPEALIVPHFDEMPAFLAPLIGLGLGGRTLFGIDGFTALVCSAGGAFALGAGGVTVVGPGGRAHYTDGQAVPWPGRAS